MISCGNERMSLCQIFAGGFLLVPSLFEDDYLDYLASTAFLFAVEHGRHVASLRIQFPTQAYYPRAFYSGLGFDHRFIAILQQYKEVPKSRENSGFTGKNFTYHV